MKKTPYLKLDLEITHELAEQFTAICWELDTIGIREELLDDGLHLAAFFHASRPASRLLNDFERKRQSLNLDLKSLQIGWLEDDLEAWMGKCRAEFRSFAATRNIFIYPSWETPSSAHPVNILLEPGNAFGTGTHESTRLAMQALENNIVGKRKVLDVGTGSGILSIAARKLSPETEVFACDIDQDAVSAARENLIRNQVSNVVLFVGSADAVGGSFDLVIGNLTLGILSRIGSELIRVGSRHIIVSGITSDQSGLLVERLRSLAPLYVSGEWNLNGWVALLLTNQARNSAPGRGIRR